MNELDREIAEADRLIDDLREAAGPPPPAPAHLDAVASAKWRELAAEVGRIDPGDGDLLEIYCQTWSRWRAADAQVQELGQVIKSPSGFPIQNPFLAIANRAAADLLKIGKRLGLSVPSR